MVGYAEANKVGLTYCVIQSHCYCARPGKYVHTIVHTKMAGTKVPRTHASKGASNSSNKRILGECSLHRLDKQGSG